MSASVQAAGAGQPGQTGLWLVTFIDLTALLIAFLVMLFAMAKLDHERWRALTDSLGEQAVTPPQVTLVESRAEVGLEPLRGEPGIDLDYLAGVLQQGLDDLGALGTARLLRRDDRLVVSLPARLLFAPGGTALDPEGRGAVAALTAVLGHVDNRIEVVGHADPRPPRSGHASNWELSLARAIAIAGLIEQAGYDRPVVTRGLGHSRYAALAPDLPEPERRRLARRVDVVVHADRGEPER